MNNIVQITYDSLRADHTGCGGYRRNTTPVLDEMANEGTQFKRAIAPASRTNPSMAGIMTGELMVFREQVSKPELARGHLKRFNTVAERLSERGYTTAAFCPNAYASRYYGFNRGFDKFEDFLFTSDMYKELFSEHLSNSRLHSALRNIRNFVRREEAFKTWDMYLADIEEWINSVSEPFYLWVFSMDTHFPYLTPRRYRNWSNLLDQYYYNWYCNNLINKFDIDLTQKERQKIVDIYDDSIFFGDQLLNALQNLLSSYDPVYFVHGDHGESFDERGLYGHFYPSLYEENIHVPWVVSGSGIGDQVIESPMSLLHLPDFVVRAANGEDLDFDTSERVIASDFDGRKNRNLIAIRINNRKVILEETQDGTRFECFDMNSNPGELNDIGGDADSFDDLIILSHLHNNTERERMKIKSAVNELEEQ